ncbi:DUF4113 domain-containing protein [Pectobacterium aroidearum]|nr:hypothetical protein DF215_12420 [Pectobacterium versatile]
MPEFGSAQGKPKHPVLSVLPEWQMKRELLSPAYTTDGKN